MLKHSQVQDALAALLVSSIAHKIALLCVPVTPISSSSPVRRYKDLPCSCQDLAYHNNQKHLNRLMKFWMIPTSDEFEGACISLCKFRSQGGSRDASQHQILPHNRSSCQWTAQYHMMRGFCFMSILKFET